MSQSWPEVRLGSLAGFKNGLNYSKKDFGKGLKVIGVSDFSDKGRISSFDGLDEVNAQNLGANLPTLKNGDILFVRSNGNRELIGRSVLIRELSEQVSFSGFTIRCRFYSDDVLPDYFGYLFRSRLIRDVLSNFGGGTNINNLNQDILSNLKVPLPPLPTQRKIAAILSAYDDLIENNTRRVRVLEDMARALYREWFVEYRFPGHEQAEFVEDEQGRRPEGWEWMKFTDTAMVLSGGTPKTTEASYWNGEIPFYTPKDSPDSFYVTTTEKTITEAGLKKCNSRLYPKDTVFITARGTVGNLALASESMAMNQSCYALDSRAELGQHFLFLLTEQLVSGLKKQATGAVFDAITVATFEKTLVIRPTREVLDDFAARVKPIFDASLSLTRRNANLRRTRDLLLPRLVSGELDVSELKISGAEEAQDVNEEAVA